MNQALKSIPQELEMGIRRIEKLDIKEQLYTDEAKAIQSTAPYGQLPYVHEVAMNKALKIQAKKAEIWNEIRHCVISDTSGKKFDTGYTLWQLALLKLDVSTFGEEKHLRFSGKDIRQLIKEAK